MFESIIDVPFTNSQLKIDLEKKILIREGKELALTETYVLSEWWKEVTTPLTIETIAYIALFQPDMPVSQWNLLKATTDNGMLTIGDLYLVNDPIESDRHPGYYIVLGYEKYVITKSGFVKDNFTGRDVPVKLHETGRKKKSNYWKCGVTSSVKGGVHIGRYRLLALAFLKPPQNPKKLDVNHINGIPTDDRLDNLEWNTRQQNSYHAYSTGLRDDNKAVLVKDILTKEVTECFSIGECARKYDSNPATIFHRCNNEFRIYDGRYLFKYKDSNKPWPAITEELLELQATPSVIAYDVFLDKITTYKTAPDAAVSCRGNMNPGTITGRANAGDDPDGPNCKPVHGYHFYRTWNFPDPLPYYNEDQIAYFRWCHENDKLVKMGFYITNVETGERVFANGHHEVKDIIGVQLSHNPQWRLGEPVKGFIIERIYESY